MRSNKLLIAHRGASSSRPENTLPAIISALEAKAHIIEVDVQLTKDLVPVLFHDTNLWRCCGIRKTIADLKLEQLKQLDFGAWMDKKFAGTSIMTLQELLGLHLQNTSLMLDLKDYWFPAATYVEALLRFLPKNTSHSLYLGCFNPDVLAHLKDRCQHGLLGIASNMKTFQQQYRLGIRHFALSKAMIKDERMQVWRKEKLTIWSWTVNRSDQAEKLCAKGVQGIITNYPCQIGRSLKNRFAASIK